MSTRKLFLASIVSNVIDKLIEFLSKSPKELTVAFIPTAADPYENKWFVDNDRNKLKERGFNLKEIDIKGNRKQELLDKFKGIDIIFVAGGNTFYLLEKAKESGFDEIVKESVQKGIIYVGSSAGATFVCPTIEPIKTLDDPSKAPSLKSFEGLNLINFVILPHFGEEKYKTKYEKIIEEYEDKDYKIITLTDKEAILVEDNKYKIIKSF
ncbi:MAG: Type 1 glutamine amidotransferase-like domain-containing protein [Candidatus Paceibacterota bacterium]|jgi:dipeptidase E